MGCQVEYNWDQSKCNGVYQPLVLDVTKLTLLRPCGQFSMGGHPRYSERKVGPLHGQAEPYVD